MGPSGVVISYMFFFATKRHSFKATLSKSAVLLGVGAAYLQFLALPPTISGTGDWGPLTASLSLPASEPGLE